jgi:transposase
VDLGGAGMKLYAGIDLHSSNNFIGVINEKDERLYQKKLSNELNQVLSALNPFKKELESIVVDPLHP